MGKRREIIYRLRIKPDLGEFNRSLQYALSAVNKWHTNVEALMRISPKVERVENLSGSVTDLSYGEIERGVLASGVRLLPGGQYKKLLGDLLSIEAEMEKLSTMRALPGISEEFAGFLQGQMTQLKKYFDLAQEQIKDYVKYSGEYLIDDAKTYKELENNMKHYLRVLEVTDDSEKESIKTLMEKVRALEKAQLGIKLMREAAGLPSDPKTLMDIDAVLTHLRRKRGIASAEDIGAIDKEIAKYEQKRRAMDLAGADARYGGFRVEEVKTYEELGEALDYYESKVKRTHGAEQAESQKTVNALKRLRAEWDATLQDLDKPGEIGTLKTLEDIGMAIGYYEDKQRRASREELGGLEQTLRALRAKEDSYRRLAELPVMEADVKEMEQMSDERLLLKLDLIGAEGIKRNIQELQEMIEDTANPLNREELRDVEALIGAWKAYEAELALSHVSARDVWGDLKGIGSGIDRITESLRGNGSAWETLTGIVDGFMGIYDGLMSILGIMEMLDRASESYTETKAAEMGVDAATAAVKEGAAGAQAVASEATVAANKMEAGSFKELAAAKYMAAHAAIPFAGYGIAAGFTAAMLATVEAAGATAFADGGIVYGPTLGLVGEYSGAGRNPEVIAPLDKLKSMIDAGDNGVAGSVRFKIKGRELVGILEKEYNVMGRR